MAARTTPVGHADRTRTLAYPPGLAVRQVRDRRAAEASPQNTLPVRVVWSPDFVADGPPPSRSVDNVPLRSAMSASDRDQIVILSSGFSGYTLTRPDGTEQTYIPQPVEAERLFSPPSADGSPPADRGRTQ